jgi:hypothetical protein
MYLIGLNTPRKLKCFAWPPVRTGGGPRRYRRGAYGCAPALIQFIYQANCFDLLTENADLR